jgi:hypothetical protein
MNKYATHPDVDQGASTQQPPLRGDVQWTRSDVFAVLMFSAVYLTTTLTLSSEKPITYNEFFTFDIASLPTFTAIFSALAGGIDNHPPLLYFATHVITAVFGKSALAIRLPSIAAYYVACVSLFALARYNMPTWCAALALWLPATSRTFLYAYEARPYAFVLAFGALAILCWQRYSATGRNRFAAGLAISLIAAGASHFYGVLVFLPVAVAETVSSLERRHVDGKLIAVVCAAAAISVAIDLPIARTISAFVTLFPEKLSLRSFYQAYNSNLGGINAIAPAVIVGSSLLYAMRSSRRHAAVALIFIPEVAAGVSLICLPIAGAGLSWVTGSAYADRYIIASMLGVGVLVPQVVSHCLNAEQVRRRAPALVLGLAVFFVILAARNYPSLRLDRQALHQEVASTEAAAKEPVPLVIQDPYRYMRLNYYASPSLRSRVVYLRSKDDLTAYFAGRSTAPAPALLAIIGASVDPEVFFRRATRFLAFADDGIDAFPPLNTMPLQIHPTIDAHIFLCERRLNQTQRSEVGF